MKQSSTRASAFFPHADRASEPSRLAGTLRIALAALWIGCFSVSTGGAAPTEKKPTLPSPIEGPTLGAQDALLQFMRGSLAELRGDPSSAFESLHHAYLIDPHSPTILRHLAHAYLREGDAARALQLASEGIDADSTDARLRFLRASILQAMDQNDRALPDYEAAAANDTSNGDYSLALARQYERLGRWEDARQVYEMAFRQFDPEPEDELRLAIVLGRLGRLEEALPILDRLRESAPDLPNLAITRAWATDALGRHAEAVPAYLDHLRENPDDRIVRRRLVNALLALGRTQEALPHAQKLYDQNPSVADARVLAGIQVRLGDLPSARALAVEARRRWPEDLTAAEFAVALLIRAKSPEAAVAEAQKVAETGLGGYRGWLLYAGALDEVKRSKDAEAAVARARAALPDSADAYIALGRSYVSLSSYDRAESSFVLALQRGADTSATWYEIAGARERKRDIPGAETAIRKVVEREPENAQALNFLGYLYADANRNLDEAVRLLRRALDLDPDNGFIMDSLGWAYYRLGRLDSARVELEKAIRSGGEDPTILEHLGDVYAALANPVEAKAKYRRALELTPDNPALRAKLQKLR